MPDLIKNKQNQEKLFRHFQGCKKFPTNTWAVVLSCIHGTDPNADLLPSSKAGPGHPAPHCPALLLCSRPNHTRAVPAGILCAAERASTVRSAPEAELAYLSAAGP